MRDRETVDIALKAAETGHMVFSTVHTPDAVKTIGRLLAVFPPEEQRGVRMRMADNLNAIISQRLIPRADGSGLLAAQEVMINHTGIAEAILNPELTHTIGEFIKNGYKADLTSSQTFDQHLVWLFKKKLITVSTAKEAATNPSDFERNLIFDGKAQSANSTNDGNSSPNIGIYPGIELERQSDRPNDRQSDEKPAQEHSTKTSTHRAGHAPPPAPVGVKSRTGTDIANPKPKKAA
jgi:Tfp pilus assembly ATPase PilU